jgi:carbon monoxide dehydrogenase subunit G
VDFTNEFRVGVPVAEAWAALTSLERIAPCMPGARLTGVDGDEHQGTIKVKVGPVTAQYQGVASFESRDAEAHRAVLVASGRETRGQGNASARVVAQLAPDGDGTLVAVATALTITGRIAQFGRGLIADVSDKLLATFATNLEAELTRSAPAGAPAPDALAHAPVEPDPGPTTPGAETYGPDTLAAESTVTETVSGDGVAAASMVDTAEVEAIDLFDVARGPLLRRALPVAAAVVVLVAVLAWLLL